MDRIRRILLLLISLLIGWVLIRFVIGGSEDDWICVDGQWVKHGFPSAPMPEGECDD